MSRFDKMKEVMYVNSPEQFLQIGSNKIFSASIIKISTLNEDVLDSEWTLTSRALRLVCTWQQVRMCASRMTNPKSLNDYFIPRRQGWFLLTAIDCWPDSLFTVQQQANAVWETRCQY